LERVVKSRENIVEKDKCVDFQVGDWKNLIPCKKGDMKCAAERDLNDRKWGPSRIIGILPMIKIKASHLG
jgi:hypothetical protein